MAISRGRIHSNPLKDWQDRALTNQARPLTLNAIWSENCKFGLRRRTVAKRTAPSLREWFDNCGGWRPRHDLDELRRGIKAGLVNEQDEYGMTALSLAVMSGWKEGVEE